ncbi:hypothetical protein BJX70DRAFT_136118 [Aspergillus crustosus]
MTHTAELPILGADLFTFSTNDTARPQINKPRCYTLDPDGDTVLVLKDAPQTLPEEVKDLLPTMLNGSAAPDTQPSIKRPLRIRTSSKHLTLASSYFAKMLGGRFREGTQLKSFGCAEIPLDETKVAPFLLLMLIIHGRTTQIPSLLQSTETLTDIAVLVDFYGFHDAVDFYARHWILDLAKDLPAASQQLSRTSSVIYASSARDWLFISWVFSTESIFRNMSKVLLISSRGDISSDGLPIPDLIIQKINEERNRFLERLIEDLNKLQSAVSKGCLFPIRGSTNNELCLYTVLGSLTKQMMDLQLLPSAPTQPFTGLAINQLLNDCRQKLHSPVITKLYTVEKHDDCALAARVKAMLVPHVEPNGLDLNAPDIAMLRQRA